MHGRFDLNIVVMGHYLIFIYQYIKILVVCPCVCDRCGRGRNEFAGRVQNYHVRSSCHRNGYKSFRATKSCCWSGHSVLQATRRMPLWTLALALAMGKNTRLFGVLDQNKTRFSTCVSQRAEGKADTVTTSSGLRTPTHSSRKSWERTTTELRTSILWLITCTGRELTFEPNSNVHARVDIVGKCCIT